MEDIDRLMMLGLISPNAMQKVMGNVSPLEGGNTLPSPDPGPAAYPSGVPGVNMDEMRENLGQIASQVGNVGTPMDWAMALAGGPSGGPLRNRIINAYAQATGGKFNTAANLADIRRLLPDIPETELNAELKRMHLDEPLHANLMRNDNTPMLTEADKDAALNAFGGPKHLLHIRSDPR